MAILAVNAGSSSLKFSLHPLQNGHVQPHTVSGCIQGLEPGGAPSLDWTHQGQKYHETLNIPAGTAPFVAALTRLRVLVQSLLVQSLESGNADHARITAVAHRVVHGGGEFTESVIVTDDVLARLARFNSLAPLHQPHNLAGIAQFRAAFPDLPQIACFDTAFHATVPDVDSAFALPQHVRDQGVRRYGFHGLSYQYIMSVLQDQTLRANGRVIMAHLGNGASLCACRHGASLATTMGFSALDGLMMGTRSGAIDAGVLLYLLAQNWTPAQIETLLYKQSGLLGVSGISADMRRLRAEAAKDGENNGNNTARRAQAAIDQFTYRVVRETGALTACLGGLDAIAFSGGIGENDVTLREQVCTRLAWLGIRMDWQRNRQTSGKTAWAIHAPDSAVEIWVIPTDEGRVAAREAAALLGGQGAVALG